MGGLPRDRYLLQMSLKLIHIKYLMNTVIQLGNALVEISMHWWNGKTWYII